jgi:hypothetical protein
MLFLKLQTHRTGTIWGPPKTTRMLYKVPLLENSGRNCERDMDQWPFSEIK